MSVLLPPFALHDNESILFERKGDIIHVHLMMLTDGRRAFAHTEMKAELVRHNRQAAAILLRADMDAAIENLKR
jgi:Mg-chelatase subunit ChlD